jgi:hypothetical protein
MTAVLPYLPIAQKDLGQWWPHIVGRVRRLSQTEEWDEGHVAAMLDSGDAELWATPAAESFIVVTVNVSPWGRSLFVWIGCNEGGDTMHHEYVPQVQRIARSKGCGRFEWESSRSGFQRAIKGVSARYLYSVEA